MQDTAIYSFDSTLLSTFLPTPTRSSATPTFVQYSTTDSSTQKTNCCSAQQIGHLNGDHENSEDPDDDEQKCQQGDGSLEELRDLVLMGVLVSLER